MKISVATLLPKVKNELTVMTMSNAEHEKKYHHGSLKLALVQSGIEILEEKGLAELSLRQIAARAGVSHTAPQNHFGNLAGLMTAIAAFGYGTLAEAMVKDLPENATRAQRREVALEGYVEFAKDNPALYELMFARERVLLDDEALQRNLRSCFLVLTDIAQELSGFAGDMEADTKGQIFLWSLVHGYAQLVIGDRLKKDAMQGVGILDILPRG